MKRKAEDLEQNEHFYAYDLKGNLHCAKECNYVDNRRYQCLDQEHRVKLVKCRSRLNKRTFRDYFAHVVGKSQRGRGDCKCCKFVESVKIRLAKQKLADATQKLAFVVKTCTKCNMKVTLITDPERCKIQVKPVQFGNKKWRFDCSLIDTIRGNQLKAVIEIVDQTYTPVSRLVHAFQHGVYLIEVPIEELDVLEETSIYPIVMNNVHVIQSLCQVCINKEYVKGRCLELDEEIYTLEALENDIFEGLLAKSLVQEAVNIRKEDMNQQAVSIMKKMKPFIVNSEFLEYPLLTMSNPCYASKMHHGLLATAKISSKKQIYVGLMEQDNNVYTLAPKIEDIMRIAKSWFKIEREFVIIFRSETLVNRRKWILEAEAAKEVFELKDIRWAVCMQIERELQICACCGKRGHSQKHCCRRLCLRCGRFNHLASECYARRDIDGQMLKSCGRRAALGE